MRVVFLVAVVTALLALNACGGGASVPVNPDTSQDVTLSGTFLQDGGLHSVSTATGLGDATVSLVSVIDGDLLGSQSTGSDGTFSFTSVEPGDALLTVEFPSDTDLDGDTINDDLTLTTPVHLEPGSDYDLTATINLEDLNVDGTSDSIAFTTVMADDSGNVEDESRLIVPEEQAVYMDSDGDGEFDDETAYVDADGDGLPDELVGHMNSLHGGMLKGPIEDIDDASLTVEGITFQITDATQWKDKGNKEPEMDVFTAGVNVLIRGYWNGTDWIALVVKTTGVRGGGDDGDDGDGGDEGAGDDGGGDGGDGGGDGGVIILF